VAVVGQVGCGKSTLLSSLLGETEKTNGQVYLQVQNESIEISKVLRTVFVFEVKNNTEAECKTFSIAINVKLSSLL
jgi:ABC-type bacteriocin/lantibiotic exporter with double-glycine peptidase domain